MSAITAKASRKMKKYAVLTREPRCFLGSFDFSWEQRKLGEIGSVSMCRRIFKEQTSETGDIPFYKIGTFGADPDAFISRELFEEYKSKYPYPQKGDILISASGSIGRTVEFAGNNEYFQDSNIVWLNHDERLSNPFLKCFYSVVKWAGIEGSTIKRLHNDNILNTVICMPSVPEQKRIGLFFENLDNLITLHQRKCANLCSPSQVVFSLLFATSTFSWEQRKLGDVVKEIIRNDPESEAPIMMITANNGFIEQSERYAFNNAGESLKKYILLKKGELAYNHGASKLRPYGSCFALTTAENARIPFVYHCFSAENQNAEFMSIELNGAEIENQLRKIVSSGARMDGLLNISFDEYTSVSVLLPGTEEQDRIADFFRHLDNLITLHQRECISFTGRADRLILTANKKRTTSSWEQRKFEEIAVRSSVICSDDTLPRVEYEDIVSGTGRLNKDIYAKQSIKSGIAFHQGDVLYGKLRPYLQNWLLPTFDGLAVGDFWVLQPQNADSSFLYRLIQSRQFDEVANQSTGTKMPRADWKLVSKTVFSIPSNISEQAAIGTYFTALDSLITLHQRKPFLMKWRTSDANRNQTNRLVL